MKIKIMGTGSAVPQHHITNTHLSTFLETDDQWISERTGIRSRYLADKNQGEDATSLAIEAGRHALEASGLDKSEIDVVIVASTSGKDLLPSTACRVQEALELENAFAYDISAACTGFIIGLSTVTGYFELGIAKKALVIGTECLSNIMDWTDRGSCILFGDGAGAAVVSAVEGHGYKPVIHSNGKQGDALICENEYTMQNDFFEILNDKKVATDDSKCNTEASNSKYKVSMDGKAVFQFAVRKVPEVIQEVLEVNNINIEEIDNFVLHQANLRIIESIAKRLKQPTDKFPTNVDQFGNTSSASIPILLDQLYRSNQFKSGDKLCMAGFGAGLTWGAYIIEV